MALDGRGRLVDVSADFTQYGGVGATNVGPVAGGPSGSLVTGNRISGPGVWFTGRHLDQDPLAWTSPDGLTWTPQEMPAEPVTKDVHRVVELGGGRLLAVSLARTSVGVLATLSTGNDYEL